MDSTQKTGGYILSCENISKSFGGTQALKGVELVAIICDNDGMSAAAQKMCNDNGRNDVICIGVDGVEVPLQMVKDGAMKATILQDGVGQINGAIEIVEAIVKGEEFEPNPVIPFVLVTEENVDDYLE